MRTKQVRVNMSDKKARMGIGNKQERMGMRNKQAKIEHVEKAGVIRKKQTRRDDEEKINKEGP